MTQLIVIIFILLMYAHLSFAQIVSVKQASKETYIEDLQLLSSDGSVNYGYVENDAKLGKYLCGGMSFTEADDASVIVSHALGFIHGYESGEGLPKYIILCDGVMTSGKPIGGIPVPPINLLMLDAGASIDHLEHLALHELYHLLEFRSNSFNDKEWQTRFGHGYANSYNGFLKNSPIGSGNAGFANSYSETFPHEDRAELFAFMILQPDKLRSIMDSVLYEKVQYIVEKCNRYWGWNLVW